ncbi:unnamed protein product [Fraxinus pennsylvanica]|uniref:Protein kinase domain-containing protein n=1 Tax=Fraxinus pennsylvanica TaxID=56036 RepID=A0AAD2A1N9_9LAMI|nr:unnamed protein product [Fraxinus pennsylvanica]
MCTTTGDENLRKSNLELVYSFTDHQQQTLDLMGSPAETPGSARSSNDENPRVKFLCSFSGSILPRPHDGKLRYVGGDTRIVSVPRDISYEDLMGRMRDLFEGATMLKYQQPEEDLDALVSVVNDDDVTNMMEEYDKLGSGDGITRLRIFLFSHSDQDGSVHFGDGDERDNERRYVDALNNLNETPEFRNQSAESLEMELLDDLYVTEQYFNQMNLDVGIHGQRNPELSMPPVNLANLTIPHMGSGLPQMEAPWSPAYYSPRQPGHLDQRPVVDFPPSPSSVRYRTPYGEFLDKSFDRMPEEHNLPPMHHQSIHDQQPQYTERAGFPGNILHGHNVYEGNSICEHCRMTFQRNQVYPDSLWKPGEQPHLEPPNLGNGYHAIPNTYAECPPNKEMYMLNADANTHHPYCSRDPTDPRALYNETHGHERGRVLLHQSVPLPEELHVSMPARPIERYIVDNGTSIPLGHGNICDEHHVQSPYTHREDPRYVRAGADFGSQVLQDQTLASGSQIQVPNYAYGADNLYQVPHGHIPVHALRRNAHSPFQGVPSGETSVSPQVANGCISNGFISGAVEGNPSLRTGLESQIPCIESSRKAVGPQGSLVPEYPHSQIANLVSNACTQENQPLYTRQPSHSGTHLASDMTNFATSVDPFTKFDSELFFDDKLVPQNIFGLGSRNDTVTGSVRIADFWKEALILSSLHHPNVVSFYGVVRDGPDGSLATVTEFMVNGSLKQFLQKKDRTIDRRKRLIIAMDAAFGMEYLHGKNIVHFDLKCENLLVNMRDPHRPVCKIGDLGLSKVKQQTLVSGGVRGTLPWMAPELLSGKSNMVTEKIDVYSFGIVMWELLTGNEPYPDMHCASIIGGIVNNTLRPQIPTWCDPEWKSLMESCWAHDPAQRPSFSEISQKLRNMAAAMNLK